MKGKVVTEIRQIGEGSFDLQLIDQFITKFQQLTLAPVEIIDYFLQISRDQGEELELGFFTAKDIVDITLSVGVVYSYTYPLSEIKSVSIQEQDDKSTLTILGRKKFDYNIVKPASLVDLEEYRDSLRRFRVTDNRH